MGCSRKGFSCKTVVLMKLEFKNLLQFRLTLQIDLKLIAKRINCLVQIKWWTYSSFRMWFQCFFTKLVHQQFCLSVLRNRNEWMTLWLKNNHLLNTHRACTTCRNILPCKQAKHSSSDVWFTLSSSEIPIWKHEVFRMGTGGMLP